MVMFIACICIYNCITAIHNLNCTLYAISRNYVRFDARHIFTASSVSI
uniref:Uncharacterized protein n=1 Tax=Anguilla anguilla TaxID=7936 RepID=A0A0E9WJF8_ANGAN